MPAKSSISPDHWSAELARRVTALLGEKLLLTLLLNIVFWGGYGWLSRQAFFSVRQMATTWLDKAVPFAPDFWAWIYLSQFVLTGGVPWLIEQREVLWRYATGLLLLSGLSFAVFLFFPVASPRPAGVVFVGPMAWIARYDGAYNAFPSLHAGFLFLIGGLGWRMFARRPSVRVVTVYVLWACAILYSTLATRQHFAWDLVAGLGLGWFADGVAWRKYVSNGRSLSGKPGLGLP